MTMMTYPSSQCFTMPKYRCKVHGIHGAHIQFGAYNVSSDSCGPPFYTPIFCLKCISDLFGHLKVGTMERVQE